MSQSFFHLTPDNDPEPEPAMGSLSYCANDGCASYTEEEHDAVMGQANALTDALFEAIDAHAETHPEMSYDVILHALDCIAYCIKAQMVEDSADA